LGAEKKGHQSAVGEKLVAILDDLMSTANQVEVMALQELRDDVSTERERHSAIIFTPAMYLFVWVRPKKVAKQALVRHISWANNPTDLLHCLKIGRKTAMHAENFLIDDRRNGEAIEALCEGFP